MEISTGSTVRRRDGGTLEEEEEEEGGALLGRERVAQHETQYKPFFYDGFMRTESGTVVIGKELSAHPAWARPFAIRTINPFIVHLGDPKLIRKPKRLKQLCIRMIERDEDEGVFYSPAYRHWKRMSHGLTHKEQLVYASPHWNITSIRKNALAAVRGFLKGKRSNFTCEMYCCDSTFCPVYEILLYYLTLLSQWIGSHFCAYCGKCSEKAMGVVLGKGSYCSKSCVKKQQRGVEKTASRNGIIQSSRH
jgi:hypothetical protein